MIDKDGKRATDAADGDVGQGAVGAADDDVGQGPVGVADDGAGQSAVGVGGSREAGAEAGPFGRQQEYDGADKDPRGLSREELEGAFETARAEIERLQEQSLRRQAELINFRRRVQREQAESAAVAQARLLEGLVPVIDDFERAVDTESEDVRSYHDGMKLILRRLQKVLEEIGVERMEPTGEAFDPRYHEAIARHETDEVPNGQVLDVYQPGYRLNERLIRPAGVVVAYGGDDVGDHPETELSKPAEDAADGDDDGGRDDA